MTIIFLLHVIIAAFMTGVIWFVQLVHYPTLGELNREQFERYNRIHFLPTTYITFPIMILELVTGAWILLDGAPDHLLLWLALNLALILIIWVSTMIIQIPIQVKMQSNPDKLWVRKLVRSNWLRTILWTIKLVFISVLYILEEIELNKFYAG